MPKCYLVCSLFDLTRKATCLLLFLLFLSKTLSAHPPHINTDDSVCVTKFNGPPRSLISRIDLGHLSFSKERDNRVNLGITGCEYHYVLIKVSPQKKGLEQYLVIDNTSLDTVSIFRIYMDGKNRLLYFGGSLVPFDYGRNYVWHTAPLDTGSSTSYYLVALKASQKNINFRYEIMEGDKLQKKYQAYERLVFFYMGIVCMITLIILLALVLFRKAVFAAYLGYIVSCSGWILSHYGRVFPYVYPHAPLINEIAKPVSSLVACICLIAVMELVFKQQLQSFVSLRKLLKGLVFLLSFVTPLMLLLLFYNLEIHVKFALMVAWHVGLIASSLVIMCTPLAFFRDNATAKIFSAAMLVICIMAIVQLYDNLADSNNYFINEHGITVGSLLEISIMAFGLFYNLLEEQKEREKQVLALEQEQTDTLKKLITVQENERKRIAGDLHDNIGPLLAALKINFRRIIRTPEAEFQDGLAARTESIIDDSIVEIRNIAHNLMPKGLSSNGLINTLKEYFDGIEHLYEKSVVFNHRVQSIFNNDLQVNVYRIICELVLNAAKHSSAHVITVDLSTKEKKVTILVGDDGSGFKTLTKSQNGSLGLQSAEGRVQYLKGIYHLNSEPGKGTNIFIEIPLELHDAEVNRF